MLRIPLSRVVPLVLVLVLLPWSAIAQPLKPVHKTHVLGASATAPLTRFRNWFLSVWEKNGCAIDPHGLCQPSNVTAPQPTADNGCAIDPGGRCSG
jgi:hypothetical protein